MPETDEKICWFKKSHYQTYKLNRFDEYALEEALLIKEVFADVSVDVITVGPETARDVVKRAFGMGADNGVHVLQDESGYCDPHTTALLIAREAKKGAYDLILTGIMSEDMMQGQTGQMVAEILDRPCGTGIVSLKTDFDAGLAFAEREIEGGLRENIEVNLPALFTIQAGINTPRYPTLSKILKADTKEIVTINAESGSKRQTAVFVAPPEKSRSGTMLEGSIEDKARQLYKILSDKHALKQ